MCTAFVQHGSSYLAGFNFDVDPAVWPYRLVMNDELFYIGIRVGSTLYKTHGVNRSGQFGVLPYCNGSVEEHRHRGPRYQRLDLLDGSWIAGKTDHAGVQAVLRTKEIVDVPGCSMHALFSDAAGHLLLIEPGRGTQRFEDCAVVTNFPLIDTPEDLSSPFYGVDRYGRAQAMLQQGELNVQQGLELLRSTVQSGQWATRVSFLYSGQENCVYYCTDGDFSAVRRHRFP